MAKYRIGWMPGDGVGVDVMDATRVALDRLGFDAEYIHGDIGWEIWRTEANPLPDRTIEMLQDVDAALFGAITSKPRDEAEQELIPELQGQGHVYRSPIVRLRQTLDRKSVV
jgi:isocitrate/isopropylmalate dehydrogenase